jgi:hypothetical protein
MRRAPDDRELEALHRRLDDLTSMDVPDGGKAWNELHARLPERAGKGAPRRAPIRRALAVAAAVVLIGGTAMAASPTVDIPVLDGLFDDRSTQNDREGSQLERDPQSDDPAGSTDDRAPSQWQSQRNDTPGSPSSSETVGASAGHDHDDDAGQSDDGASHDDDEAEDLDDRGSNDVDDDGSDEQGDGESQDLDDHGHSGHGGGSSSDPDDADED